MMGIRSLAVCALAAAFGAGCGSRTDLLDSLGGASIDAGSAVDGGATSSTPATMDGGGTAPSGSAPLGGMLGDAGASADGGAAADAGASADAAAAADADAGDCVDVDLSTYDTTCTTAGDCTYVASGTVCTQVCGGCGNALINLREQARYEQALAGLPLPVGQCGCPDMPAPRCVQGQCVFPPQ